MKITYTSWKVFRSCPKRFDLEYVQKVKPTIKENKYHTLYGSLVGKFFEVFCNIWRFTTPYLFPEDMREKLKTLYTGVLDTTPVDWSAKFIKVSKEEILEVAFKDVRDIMNSTNQNYFLNTKSEVTLRASLKDGNTLEGRVDFIHKELNDDVLIIDGKGTDKIGKNVDQDQALFYSLLYLLHYGQIPNEVGFFYYRFNQISKIPVDVVVLNAFRAKLSLDIKEITQNIKKAKPSHKTCQYCPYRTNCQECLSRIAESKRPSIIKDLNHNGDLVEFGF